MPVRPIRVRRRRDRFRRRSRPATTKLSSPPPSGPVKDAFVGAELIDASDFTRREDALLGRGETGRMIADLTRAIELSPGDAHSFFSRAREKTEQKGNVKALADLDRSLARAQGG